MIARMEKHTFLLHHSEQEKFLEAIGEVGVMDISVGEYNASTIEADIIVQIASLQSTVQTLKNFSITKDLTNLTPITISTQEAIETFTESWAKAEVLRAKIAKADKDIAVSRVWGAFRIGRIAQLQQVGIDIRYFSCAEKDFSLQFESMYNVAHIATENKTVYFIGFTKGREELILPDIHYTEHRRLSMDVNEFSKRRTKWVQDLEAIDDILIGLCTIIPQLERYIVELKANLRQENIISGSNRAADGSLVIVQGWSPVEDTAALISVVDSFDGVVAFKENPIPEDNPPIKLKNKKLFSPAEIITRLFSLPNYNEVDMTPFFTPFFVFFVGMCLCDAVYGAIFFFGALIARFKVGESLKPIMTLVMWCGAAAILMGVVTGMYGGITLESTMLLTSDNMFYFAIGVGILQILYAMLLQAYFRMKRFGFLYGLSHLGWAMTLITVIAAMVMPMAEIGTFSTDSQLFMPLIIVGLFLTIFFQNPKANPFTNFGAGLWFLYNAATGLLSDTLSYVRLFALGLSGGIIAGVFNTLATELSPDFPVVKYLVMFIILAIGHGINIFMSAISAFVHPLRLTFVEFYKNVGFEGGGKAYDPFVKRGVDLKK